MHRTTTNSSGKTVIGAGWFVSWLTLSFRRERLDCFPTPESLSRGTYAEVYRLSERPTTPLYANSPRQGKPEFAPLLPPAIVHRTDRHARPDTDPAPSSDSPTGEARIVFDFTEGKPGGEAQIIFEYMSPKPVLGHASGHRIRDTRWSLRDFGLRAARSLRSLHVQYYQYTDSILDIPTDIRLLGRPLAWSIHDGQDSHIYFLSEPDSDTWTPARPGVADVAGAPGRLQRQSPRRPRSRLRVHAFRHGLHPSKRVSASWFQ